MRLMQDMHGHIQLNDDGTYVRHPYTFATVGSDIVRYTHDEAGRVIAKEFYEPHDLLTIDSVTGDVLQTQTGFIAEHELVAPVHADADKRYVQIRPSALPADLIRKINIADQPERIDFAYRWDATQGALVKRDSV